MVELLLADERVYCGNHPVRIAADKLLVAKLLERPIGGSDAALAGDFAPNFGDALPEIPRLLAGGLLGRRDANVTAGRGQLRTDHSEVATNFVEDFELPR